MDQKPFQSNVSGFNVPTTAARADDSPKSTKKSKGGKIFFFTLVLIIILVVAGFLVDKYTSINLLGFTAETTSSDDYSAIFLSNGQVYFGIITDNDNDYTILKDIYYLQVSSALQQVPPSQAEQQPQLTLVKLGNELHGPEDYMQINNSHIIFVENLKQDGKVVGAINQYKIDEGIMPLK